MKFAVPVVLLVLLGYLEPGAASMCVKRSVEEKFVKADAVFSASIVGVDDPCADDSSISNADVLVFHYRALHSWKGDPGATGAFRAWRSSASVGQTYLIFALGRPDGFWSNGRCSGSEPFSLALEQRLILGKPTIVYAALPEPVTLDYLWSAMENTGALANHAASLLAELGLQESLVAWARGREWEFSPGESFEQLLNVLALAGPAGMPFVRELDSYLSKSKVPEVKEYWIDLLIYLGEGDELVQWIWRGLADQSEWVRYAAGRATSKLTGETAQQLMTLLERELSNTDYQRRKDVVNALSHFFVLEPWTIDAVCEEPAGDYESGSRFHRNCIHAVLNNRDAALQSATGKQVIADLENRNSW
ncbi:MAG: hypothetical protein AAF736_14835 [Pseudomonadota bacterium]